MKWHEKTSWQVVVFFGIIATAFALCAAIRYLIAAPSDTDTRIVASLDLRSGEVSVDSLLRWRERVQLRVAPSNRKRRYVTVLHVDTQAYDQNKIYWDRAEHHLSQQLEQALEKSGDPVLVRYGKGLGAVGVVMAVHDLGERTGFLEYLKRLWFKCCWESEEERERRLRETITFPDQPVLD